MNKMELMPILEKVNFVKRYRAICSHHNNFENGLRGSDKKEYKEILEKFGYKFKYYAKGTFFKVSENDVNLHLVLKDGLVEPFLYVVKNKSSILPRGRFDGIAEEMHQGFRDEFTIPKYCSLGELEVILKEIFLIYEDIKKEILEQGLPSL